MIMYKGSKIIPLACLSSPRICSDQYSSELAGYIADVTFTPSHPDDTQHHPVFTIYNAVAACFVPATTTRANVSDHAIVCPSADAGSICSGGNPGRPVGTSKGCFPLSNSVLSQFDQRIDEQIDLILRQVERSSVTVGPGDVPLYDLLRYHLGRVDQELNPITAYPGKRIRPRLAILTCAAAGGDPESAYRLAAAIELIHNFTLIHDDVQDRSAERRHRPTIWALWGEGQAINAGDAMFVVAHLTLNQLADAFGAARALELSNWLHRTTLNIVEGQTLDLSFEQRDDVRADEYLAMIRGKTAAIMRFAAGAGAFLADADDETVHRYGDFGEALGVGFQIQDDLLGVWGSADLTGKPVADDIRRRKKGFPLILLQQRLSAADRHKLKALFERDVITEADVEHVLSLMEQHHVRSATEAEVDRWHDRAADVLESTSCPPEILSKLETLVEALSSRRA